MADSSKAKRTSKPDKPNKDFPLYAHANRQWAKKVRGKTHFFGSWDDPDAALNLWLQQKDELLAGRKPRARNSDGLTVGQACDLFINFKSDLRDAGELAPRTYKRYYDTCEFIVENIGKNRLVDDLVSEDFQQLRATMAKRWGAIALGNEIQIVRSIFRYIFEAGYIDKPVRFGPAFAKPSARVLRKTRNANGPKLFTADQVNRILENATTNMKAMVLLGLNGGLGNTDLGELPIGAVDLETGWLDYARSKTGIQRRIPLWKETIEAMRAALKERPTPNSQDDNNLFFIGPRGESYVGEHRGYRVHQEARRIFKNAKVTDRTFYDLRRTFQTIAEEARDLVAVQSIMGHAPSAGDMSAIYRQGVSDERLTAVTQHVRQWLFGGKGGAK